MADHVDYEVALSTMSVSAKRRLFNLVRVLQRFRISVGRVESEGFGHGKVYTAEADLSRFSLMSFGLMATLTFSKFSAPPHSRESIVQERRCDRENDTWVIWYGRCLRARGPFSQFSAVLPTHCPLMCCPVGTSNLSKQTSLHILFSSLGRQPWPPNCKKTVVAFAIDVFARRVLGDRLAKIYRAPLHNHLAR